MANVDSPFGFRPVSMLDGSPYSGAMRECAILAADGTATFIGDAVTLTGTADAEGRPAVRQANANEAVFGVVVGFEYDPNDLTDQDRKASTLRRCQVVPALDCLFEVQTSGSFAITDVANFADLTVGSGSTVNGLSAMELDSATYGTGATLHVLGFVDRPDNEIGNNAKVLVRFNESQLRGTGTAA